MPDFQALQTVADRHAAASSSSSTSMGANQIVPVPSEKYVYETFEGVIPATQRTYASVVKQFKSGCHGQGPQVRSILDGRLHKPMNRVGDFSADRQARKEKHEAKVATPSGREAHREACAKAEAKPERETYKHDYAKDVRTNPETRPAHRASQNAAQSKHYHFGGGAQYQSDWARTDAGKDGRGQSFHGKQRQKRKAEAEGKSIDPRTTGLGWSARSRARRGRDMPRLRRRKKRAMVLRRPREATQAHRVARRRSPSSRSRHGTHHHLIIATIIIASHSTSTAYNGSDHPHRSPSSLKISPPWPPAGNFSSSSSCRRLSLHLDIHKVFLSCNILSPSVVERATHERLLHSTLSEEGSARAG